MGCDDKSIKQLDPNDKSIQWIEINGDCSVDIKYLLNGVEKQETIVGYASGPMGQRLQYEIGQDD